jgi:hypothetical protein
MLKLKKEIMLVVVAVTILIVVVAAVSLHQHYVQKQMVGGEQTEPDKLEPQISAGCSQVVWEGNEVELHASTRNIENPTFVWFSSSEKEVLSTQRALTHVFDLGEHIILLNVTSGDDEKTLGARTKVIVIDRVENISVGVTAGALHNERIFQTNYLGSNILIKGVRINVDGSEYDKMHGCGRISVTGLSAGTHRWTATYRGDIVSNGTLNLAEITEFRIKEVSIAPKYHVGDMVDAKLVVQNSGTAPIDKFVVKVRIVNPKYEWMGDIAKPEYRTEYNYALSPGQQKDIPVRAKIPERVGVVKPTGKYSITIDLLIDDEVTDSKTVKTEVI